MPCQPGKASNDKKPAKLRVAWTHSWVSENEFDICNGGWALFERAPFRSLACVWVDLQLDIWGPNLKSLKLRETLSEHQEYLDCRNAWYAHL